MQQPLPGSTARAGGPAPPAPRGSPRIPPKPLRAPTSPSGPPETSAWSRGPARLSARSRLPAWPRCHPGATATAPRGHGDAGGGLGPCPCSASRASPPRPAASAVPLELGGLRGAPGGSGGSVAGGVGRSRCAAAGGGRRQRGQTAPARLVPAEERRRAARHGRLPQPRCGAGSCWWQGKGDTGRSGGSEGLKGARRGSGGLLDSPQPGRAAGRAGVTAREAAALS